MKTKDGRITEATIDELRQLWLHYEVWEILSFEEYLAKFRDAGTTIIQNKE